MKSPDYPFFTASYSTTNAEQLDYVYAYLSNAHKVRLSLLNGMEAITIDNSPYTGVEKPKWEVTDERHKWVEVVCTKQLFTDALKYVQQRLADTMVGKDAPYPEIYPVLGSKKTTNAQSSVALSKKSKKSNSTILLQF